MMDWLLVNDVYGILVCGERNIICTIETFTGVDGDHFNSALLVNK